MGLKTALTEALGIEHPVVCGGMMQVGFAELAAAVSNAGGLGMLTGLLFPTPEALRQEIRRTRTMTEKPFGVNVTILPMLIPADYDAYVDVVCQERVKVIEISGGSPKKYTKQLHDAGVKIIHKSATIKHALKAEAAGVDFVEIAGFESSIAGRSSEDDVTLWVLGAKALGKLKVPVIFSGASGTGRQLAAALAMGACGITMGTRFLATVECPIQQGIKDHVADPETDEFSTTLVLRTFKNATRVLKNDVSREILRLEEEADGDFSKVAALAKGERTRRAFHETGDWNDAMWSCGQSVGLIEKVQTCKDLLTEIVSEAQANLTNAASFCVTKSAL